MAASTINGWSSSSLAPSYSVVQSILGGGGTWSPAANTSAPNATYNSLQTAPWMVQQQNSGWVANPGLIPAAISGGATTPGLAAPLPSVAPRGGNLQLPLNLNVENPKEIFDRLRAASIAKAAERAAAAAGPPPLTPGTVNWAGGPLPSASPSALAGFGETEGFPNEAGIKQMIEHTSSRKPNTGGITTRGAERQMVRDRTRAYINGAPQSLLDSLTLVPFDRSTLGPRETNPNAVWAQQQATADRAILGDYLTVSAGWL